MSALAIPWSVATWLTTGWSRSRMPSRSEASGPETPASSEVAVVGEAAQAGEGVQSGWVKSSICPRVVLESGFPSGSVTLLVTMTAYSVFSSSGGSATGPPAVGSVSAGWMPITVATQVGPKSPWAFTGAQGCPVLGSRVMGGGWK